jgi:hypothetical protein
VAAPQPSSASVDFREGEAIIWAARDAIDPSPTRQHAPSSHALPDNLGMGARTTLRPVIFQEIVDERYAHVRFGTNTQRVLIAELRRPAPPEYRQHPSPASPTRVTVDLAPLRATLRQRHAEAHAAVKFAAEAAGAADRADTALRDAQAALARFAEHDRTAAARFVDALRSGSTEDQHGPANTSDREAARRRCDAAQQAARQLTAELAAARAAVREADTRIHTAVRAVVVGIAEREGDVLERLEDEVAQRRADLRALAGYRPAALTGSAPSEIALPGRILALLTPAPRQGSSTATRWANLYTRLAAGDAEADIET